MGHTKPAICFISQRWQDSLLDRRYKSASFKITSEFSEIAKNTTPPLTDYSKNMDIYNY